MNAAHSDAYAPSAASSSSWVPCSTTRPPVDHGDPVRAGRRGEPVRHQQRGAPVGQPLGRVDHRRLGRQVERGRRLVQQQDVRVDQIGAGQRDQLALPSRQVAAAFGDLVAESAGQPADHVQRADGPGRGHHLGIAGVRPAIGDRVPDGTREQVRLLRHHTQPPPVAGQVVVPHVHPVHQHRAAGHVVEPGHQLDDGGLARAGLPDQGHRLARRHHQVHPGQRGALASRVAEAHVAELDPGAGPPGRAGVRGFRGAGRRAEQRADPAQPDRGLLVAVEHLGQLLHRGEQHVDVQQVGHQCAGGEQAAAHLARRDQQNQRAGRGGQRLHEREVHRDIALGPQPRPPVGVAQPGEARPGCAPRAGTPG